jgi:cyclic pyranopterin phosphate synthase
LFVANGVEKVRLTGGEPLVRARLDTLVGMLAPTEGLLDLTLTTNGVLLATQAQRLRDAGLKRVTVSLDSLHDQVFRRMNDSDVGVEAVLRGIDAAAAAGLAPIKINAVVQRGVNDHTIVDLARHFHSTGHIVRFIEFMDVGTTNGWKLDQVVAAKEIVERIDAEMPLEPAEANYRGEVAQRYRYKDGGGEIGVISSISQPFCGDCTRARLSPEGELFTCLFAARGTDFRSLLRAGAGDEEISAVIARTWGARTDRYSEIRSDETVGLEKVEMSHIGG